MTQQFRFEDGAAYERIMGQWSQRAGDIFLDWLAPPPHLRWIDVGCGNGAFTELIVTRCSPSAIDGIDPSEGQLAFARGRHKASVAQFHQGDAMSLAFTPATFDIAVMALVIFFVPDPLAGVREMLRVVKPGATVAAFAWDIPGGGFPLEPILDEMRRAGLDPPRPPRAEVSREGALAELWTAAKLEQVETRGIDVTRPFEDFEDYWTSSLAGGLGQMVAKLPPAEAARLKERIRDRVGGATARPLVLPARANMVKGRVAA